MLDKKRGAKTESLSLRIDPKTKFVLEFVVRVKGYRITDVIERAIKEYADKITVGGDYGTAEKSWIDYWHAEEGVRTIKLITDKLVSTTFEEDELVNFIDQHSIFFFIGTGDHKQPRTAYIQVLWPRIEEYLNHWRENKSVNWWATGKLMLEALSSANIAGPEWPPTTKAKSAPASFQREEMDDEIPF